MNILNITLNQADEEKEHIVSFLEEQLRDNTEKVVIGVSGGVDSDVVTRLAEKAIGAERIKLFMAIQEGMDPRHLTNARQLAQDVRAPLIEIYLADYPKAFINALNNADPSEHFRPDGLLDPSRAKCSVRTVILSTYLDRGYLVLGCSNRTELEMGFFLPFGDGLGHIKPIVHLYKSQVYQLAHTLGTRQGVIDQPASSGFWVGAEDIEDMAFWLYNEAPIAQERSFNAKDLDVVARIRSAITFKKVDLGLLGIASGMNDTSIVQASELPMDIVMRLRKLTTAAQRFKRRPLGIRLENYS